MLLVKYEELIYCMNWISDQNNAIPFIIIIIISVFQLSHLHPDNNVQDITTLWPKALYM